MYTTLIVVAIVILVLVLLDNASKTLKKILRSILNTVKYIFGTPKRLFTWKKADSKRRQEIKEEKLENKKLKAVKKLKMKVLAEYFETRFINECHDIVNDARVLKLEKEFDAEMTLLKKKK